MLVAAINHTTAQVKPAGDREDSVRLQLQMTAADRWYKNSFIYNLDVRTFQDSDGDGFGDFRGLTARLLYLRSLGVDVIWLAPFQPSPHKDDGYDVADYYRIDSTCGTPGDFAEFLYRAHSLGFRVIMDIVFAHSSDEHPWFLRAAADTTSLYHSWYTWSKDRPANQHKGMAFPGVQTEVWTYNKQAGEYYFHRFYNFQPHLNFSNPQVQQEAERILGYWLGQGLDGFRIDAVPFIIELPDKTGDKFPHQLTLVPALRQFVQWRKADALLLGEANVMPEENSGYFGKMGEGLHMMFNFYANQYLFYGLATGDITLMRRAMLETKGIPIVSQWAWFLRNHDEIDLGRLTDQQRAQVEQRMGPDKKTMQLYDRGIRRRLAPMLHNPAELKMAYSLLFSLPGTPVIHYGEELGMGDDLNLQERLSVRTPMQWSDEDNAGFTSGHPFRPMITNKEYGYAKINVQEEEHDTLSLLNHIRRMIQLRKECPEIGLGDWSIADSSNASVLVVKYRYQGRSVLVYHNFSDSPQQMVVRLNTGTGLRDLVTGVETKKASGDDGRPVVFTLDGYGYKWFRIIDRTNSLWPQ